MAVAIDVVRGEKNLSQVAAEHGAGPSLAAEWRDELLDGADDVFGKTQQERERKRSEEAARKGMLSAGSEQGDRLPLHGAPRDGR